MTKIVLPKMIKAKKGIVVNLSSVAGISPMLFYTVYSATKVPFSPGTFMLSVYALYCRHLLIIFLRVSAKSIVIKESLFR